MGNLRALHGPGINTIIGGTGTNNIYGDGHGTIYGNGLHDILDGVPSSDRIYCHGSGLSCDDIQGFGDGGSEIGVVADLFCLRCRPPRSSRQQLTQ